MSKGFMTWWGEVNNIFRDNDEDLPLKPALWGCLYYSKGLTPQHAFLKYLEGPELTAEELAEAERFQKELEREYPNAGPIDGSDVPFPLED